MSNNMIIRFPAGSAPDSRKTVPWKELSPEIKTLVKRASGGSLEGLQVLVAWMELNKLTARQECILPILYRHLDEDPPASLTTKSDLLKAKYASAALEGVLQSFLWQFSVKAISTSLTFQHFVRLWPTIWKWIQILYLNIYKNGLFRELDSPLIEGTDDHRTVLTIRRLFVVVFEGRYQLTSTILETPGFIPVLTDVWVRLSETKSGPLYASDAWTTITAYLLDVLQKEPYPQIVVDALEGDTSRLATLILNNLRTLTQDGGLSSMRLVTPLVSFLSTTSLTIPGLSNALLSQNGMVEVMRTWAYYLDTPSTQVGLAEWPGYLVRTCVWSCLIYVQAMSRISDGYTWLTQAIRSRLIQTMLKSMALPSGVSNFPDLPQKLSFALSHTSTEGLEIEMVCVIKILSIFLIYRSFTKEVEQAMADPQILLLESRIPRGGELWKVWKDFKLLVNDRVTVKRVFDETSGKYTLLCSFPECGNKETTKYFKLCSACQTSPYCSKVCQAKDWKSGRHRTYCNMVRNYRAEGKPMPIADHDHHFMQFRTQFDVRRHRRKLMKARDVVLAEKNARDYVIYVEFAGPPLAFIVDVPDAFPESISTALREPRRMKGTGLPLVFLLVNVPYGKSHQMTIFGADMADSPDFWVRRIMSSDFGDDIMYVDEDVLVARANSLVIAPPDEPGGLLMEPTVAIFDCPYDPKQWIGY